MSMTMDKKRLDSFKKRLEQRQQELRQTVSRTQQDGRSADEDATQDVADKAANSYNGRKRAQPYSRRQFRRVHPLRKRDQCQTAGSGAVDPQLHRVPGEIRAGTVGGDSEVDSPRLQTRAVGVQPTACALGHLLSAEVHIFDAAVFCLLN